MCGRAERVEGWKLHLSATPADARRVLERVVPVLQEESVPFKVARDEETLSRLNEGLLGATQVGKFMTVYPPSDADAQRLAVQLAEATAGLRGPTIVTDRRLGDVLFTRFGGFNPIVRRDRLGHVSLSIRTPDGSVVRDEYRVPFAPPEGVADPFGDFPPYDAVNGGGPRQKLFGGRYLLLETLSSSPRGSVFLALDLRARAEVGPVVLKEGRRHCLEDRFGRDMRARLRHLERAHRLLSDIAPVPAAGEYFEVAGNGYLPLAYLEGRRLEDSLGQPFQALEPGEQRAVLGTLAGIARAIASLHAAGWLHRDLTPANVLVAPDGGIWLVDLELAHELGGDEPPFSLGTPGFASPQQEAGLAPSSADDVYSLGSVAIAALSGFDPRRVHHAGQAGRAARLEMLAGVAPEVASVVGRCVSRRPAARPRIEELIEALESGPSPTRGVRRRLALEGRARRCVRAAAIGLLEGTLRDPVSGLWLSHELEQARGQGESPAQAYSLYRSASRGIAGVVYALARLVRFDLAPTGAQRQIEGAVDWLLAHHPTADDQLPGLHFGEAGVAVAVAEAVAAGSIAHGPWLEPYLVEALSGPLDWPDVTHGAAGQGIAALAVTDLLGLDSLPPLADRCAAYLIDTQDAEGAWPWPEGVDDMAGTRYTGFAHGTAGIVYFLAEHGARFDEPRSTAAAQAAGIWLERIAQPAGADALTWPMKVGDPEIWRWWCHGAPGIALAYLRLYERTADHRFAHLANGALRSIHTHVRSSNLSQCHGLAGLVEIFLEADRVLREAQWRAAAAELADVLLCLARTGSRTGATWLVEDPFNATADLMVGCGGVAHALLRIGVGGASIGPPLLLAPPAGARSVALGARHHGHQGTGARLK
jgi:hypothetical protein